MINRQRTIIRLIANEGGKITKLRLVKLAFLLSKSTEELAKPSLYEFLPYHYGPYSFTLSHELRAIERDGWVRIEGGDVSLLRNVQVETAKLGRDPLTEISVLSRRYKNVSTENLVASVYREYPWYTTRAKDKSRRSAQVINAKPKVFTVGYEGLMIDGLLDLLLKNGVKRLIDVRCNAVARRFGFHRSTLDRHCTDVGITYLHVPALGIPSDQRTHLDDVHSYNRLFDHYEKMILPTQENSIKLVSSLMQQEPSALMCMEAETQLCHRSRLARAIAKDSDLEIKELRVQ